MIIFFAFLAILAGLMLGFAFALLLSPAAGLVAGIVGAVAVFGVGCWMGKRS